ncbi:penicillin-binding protein 1C [Candidatus Aerophobetes bacterium Ae_b3b]|nr:MAG: penicillin-binding protein 1C [Candidatus Aerophobetes bacterium Ae_b3b]
MKIFSVSLGFVLVLLGVSLYIPFSRKALEPASVVSLRILDRKGNLLREVLSDQEGRSRWVSLPEISPNAILATLAAEDSRFYEHPGIDIRAIARAIIQNIRARRIVSGGSTLTQQVVKNIYHFPRNWFWKMVEIWYALRLEISRSKDEILTQYLNRISYGNQTFGINAASSLYFDKPPSHLSLAEAAFLAGLPRGPSLYNPYRHQLRAQKRQREVLRRMLNKGMIKQEEYRRAFKEPLNLISPEISFRAPHFCDLVLSKISPKERQNISSLRTTLDFELQKDVEVLLRNSVKSLKKWEVSNAAAVIMDNKSGEILCLVGSANFFDSYHSGQVSAVTSLRQPGSALKPFTYALALEQGMTPATLILDTEIRIRGKEVDYVPRNYDGKFHGLIRLREALACSYNVSAIRVLENIGIESLLHRLKKLGFETLDKGADYYGLGLTLGGGEVTLLELARAYGALARSGVFKKERIFLEAKDIQDRTKSFPKGSSRRVFSPEVSYIITNILQDRDARIPAFGEGSCLSLPFPCAVKTGTSANFRDNWAIGYTPHHTVGVWVGNFDGRPMQSVSGVSGAGPLFRDIMLLLERREKRRNFDFTIPAGLMEVYVCPQSGMLVGSFCPGKIKEIFIKGTEPKDVCNFCDGKLLVNSRNGK